MGAWIRREDLKFIIRGKYVQTVIDRMTWRGHFSLIKVLRDQHMNDEEDGWYHYLGVEIIPQEGCDADENYRYFLHDTWDKLILDSMEHSVPLDTVMRDWSGTIMHVSKAEVNRLASGGTLIYENPLAGFGFSYESVANKRFLNEILRLKPDTNAGDNLKLEAFIDIKVFLRRIGAFSDDHDCMMPVDVRDLSVNNVLMDSITETANEEDVATILEYEIENGRTAAQYFYLKTRGSKEIVNFRIEAFLLPGSINTTYDEIPESKKTTNRKNRKPYYIDSIILDKDMVDNLEDADSWISAMWFL